MGQAINVAEAVVAGEVAMFDTDRSLSGQDGENYASGAAAADGSTFPARLASRLFSVDPSVNNVYVFSNAISVRRAGGWPVESLAGVGRVIEDFFIVYGDGTAE